MSIHKYFNAVNSAEKVSAFMTAFMIYVKKDILFHNFIYLSNCIIILRSKIKKEPAVTSRTHSKQSKNSLTYFTRVTTSAFERAFQKNETAAAACSL